MEAELEAVRAGEVLAGKYRVDRVLGVGGMGVVVAATHLQLDQQVALKFIRREAMMNPEIVSRFEREARAAVRLKSEHVARIIDVGRLDTGAPYIVMEYLEGQDLAAVLERQGALAVPRACDIVIQACDAIAEAHGLGIVHRDLKPANLFLASTSHGQQIVKVLDFGISKSNALVGDPNMTRTQAVMGSPGYMSPEQMRSAKNVDGRTDVWSLGVILYELVLGRLPFQADTFTALCLKIAMDPLPPLPPLPTALPAGFEAVLRRALDKDPALRYPTAVELAGALAPFANIEARDRAYRLIALTASAASGGRVVPTTPTTPTISTLDAVIGQAQQATSPTRSRRGTLMGVAVGTIAAIALVIGVAARGGDTAVDRPAPAAPPRSDPVGSAPAPPPRSPRPPLADPPTVVVAPIDAGLPPADATNAADALRPPAPARPRATPRADVDPFNSPD